jgi:hypothetical protein
MARPAPDVEHRLPGNGRASLNSLLVSQPHAGSKVTVNEPIYKGIAVSVNSVKVAGVGIEKL